jgi:predicted nucleotidyltransferase component of viral defense system
MINTVMQLKALVRNLSGGDSTKAQTIIRSYATEPFLERLSLSDYRDKVILKGGTLIVSMIGLDSRSTMDIDTSIENLPLTVDEITKIVEDVSVVEIDDGMTFEIKQVSTIMDEMEYPDCTSLAYCEVRPNEDTAQDRFFDR